MTTLASLSADCFSYILEYLHGSDIHALCSTGERALRTKVKNNVRSLKLRCSQNENFPFSALKLPLLQKLHLFGNRLTYMRFNEPHTGDRSLTARQNLRITSLRFQFANASVLFARPGSLSLEKRFPSLTELHLQCAGTIDLVIAFGSLPKTLTELVIHASAVPYEPTHHLNLFYISKLPRSLLTLDLNWQYTYVRDNVSVAGALPPQLTSLSLAALSTPDIMFHLPSSLTSLCLYFVSLSRVTMSTTLLPPNMTYLTVNLPLSVDSPLPSSLTFISVPDQTLNTLLTLDGDNLNSTGLPLPPKMAFSSSSDAESRPPGFYRRFKRIRSAYVNTEEELADILQDPLPGYPEFIRITNENLKLPKPLPSDLKTVSFSGSPHSDDLQMLPRSLTYLHVDTPYEPPAAVPSVPHWTFEQVGMLPKSLRQLEIYFGLVGDGEKLAPISALPLESFNLASVPVEHLELAPNWLGKCLPFHLQSFSCSTPLFGETDEEISPDFIRLCKLDEVVPHLHTIYVGISFSNSAPMGPLFASLPRNLLNVNFTLTDVFEPEALSYLPRSIDRLSLSFYDSQEDVWKGCMTNEHLKGLPEQLVELIVSLPSIGQLDEGLLQYLPQTISHVNIFALDGTPKNGLKPKIEEFLRNNACPRMSKRSWQ